MKSQRSPFVRWPRLQQLSSGRLSGGQNSSAVVLGRMVLRGVLLQFSTICRIEILAKRLTSSIIEALICQRFRVPTRRRSISARSPGALNSESNIQSPHGANDRPREWRRLVGRVSTHFRSCIESSTEHEAKVRTDKMIQVTLSSEKVPGFLGSTNVFS